MYWLDWRVNGVIRELSDEFFTAFISDVVGSGYTVTDARKEKLKQVVNCFFLNLSLFSNDGVLKITLKKSHYSSDLIYNGRKIKRKVSYKYTMMFFDWLQQNEHATLTKGCVLRYGTDHYGKLTPMECESSQLVLSDNFMSKYGGIIKDKKNIPPFQNVLRMRGVDSKDMTFKMGEYESWVCGLLKSINKGNKEFNIQCGDRMFDVQLSKVYNQGSLNKGGRTYVVGGGSSVLNREYRSNLVVDGEPTVELDFKSLHPRMIATMYGWNIPVDHDPYEIEVHGYHPEALRKICKLLILCMFNAKSKNSALLAVAKEIREAITTDRDGNEVSLGQYWIDNGMTPKYIELKYIGGLLLDHNPYVKEAAYSGCGLDLQNLDSRIMDIVLAYFHERNEFCLPVHDSVVVRKPLQGEADRVMRDAFAQVMGNADNCIIEVK